MEVNDPFASITELCHVSSSQEDHLRHCRFVGEPEVQKEEEESNDSGEVPVYGTSIMMVSPPESSEDNRQNYNNTPHDNEAFQTPPEGFLVSGSDGRTAVIEEDTLGGHTAGEKTVDLGADTDMEPGFSEVELTQRTHSVNEVISCEARVLKRESAINECLSGSLSKKVKILDKNLGSVSENKYLMRSVEMLKKLNSNNECPCSCSSKSAQSSQVSEGSIAKRKLDFSTEILGLETEASDRDLGFSEGLENNVRNLEANRLVRKNINGEENSNLGRKSIEDIDKFRYAGPSLQDSREMESRTQGLRALPVSFCSEAEKNAGKESDAGRNKGEITLLDVLRMLARNCDYDSNIENKSILDVAKSRGITFP